ncbi:hypothetical protein L5515_014045 [Caenorhabditis briggsae]|uniref:Uncharacterized protein n=1 Tax=Caenorhabditis briggsae TaxID=6238 RepID=A0AAE9EC42_CAEBR|nr:hypothetical protein L5515_014045 [Caenorhabditis briggsae]
MRIMPLLAVFTLLIACSAHVPSVDDILQTNQYVLISQQDILTSIQTSVPSGRCPQFMARPTNKPRSKHSSDSRVLGVHLIRDHLSRSPPMLMTVTQKYSPSSSVQHQQISIQTFALNVTDVFQSKFRRGVEFAKKAEARSYQVFGTDRSITTLFDSMNHMLYLLTSSSSANFKMYQYYIKGLYNKGLSITQGVEYSQSSSSSRYDWQEDQYSGKFYYKEKIDAEVGLFEIPMNALVPTAFEGEPGVKIAENYNETLAGANGGAFFNLDIVHGKNSTTMVSSLMSSSLEHGFKCAATVNKSSVPFFNKLIVIREQDFCMLRDGLNYNRAYCKQEQRDFLGLGPEGEESSIVKWLLVTCIIMFMVIVLLFVYIYWLRATFTSDYDRTHPNEYETEASLFVAKQRSFPSVYQDPALLDVSVDRWN